MPEADRALSNVEDNVHNLLAFAKACAYGLRLAGKRIGDLTVSAAGSGKTSVPAGSEVGALAEGLEQADARLSDTVALALGDYFRAFLAQALELDEPPALPLAPAGVEELAGTPGAFGDAPFWFALGLLLYRAALDGGALSHEVMLALGTDELEIAFPDGKVKLFQAGDQVTLGASQFETLATAYLDAARAVRLRILTA